MVRFLSGLLLIIVSLGWFTACNLFRSSSASRESEMISPTTGWSYNDPSTGGFRVDDGVVQATGPGLVFIEGGTFTMGRTQEDIMGDWNNELRRVTVESFYIDQTEVRNVDYREYLHWLKVSGNDPDRYERALPDTLVWRNEWSYNEPLLENYLSHPSFNDYPVVGVSWVQANDYCAWRTERVNERIVAGGGQPLPRYRLPTEAEWEYAAWGLVGNTRNERQYEGRIYPWRGDNLRNGDRKYRGQMMANFARGRGDLMGVAGALNDGGSTTMPVASFQPNDFGLYCMAGNVNEWVMDVYRPLSSQEINELNPFRGPDALAEDTTGAEVSSLITDASRVYKGGSWRDRPYWLSPGTRRYLDENQSRNDIGFRCAMTRVGSRAMESGR